LHVQSRIAALAAIGHLQNMQVISSKDVESNLAHFLVSVEAGEEFVISSGPKLVARLVPFTVRPDGSRPKVGELISPPFEVSAAALAPLKSDEFKQWGL
jgi:antitoxin (DNA-binding transcriptional repressor) of toxin-antitoxin stability system